MKKQRLSLIITVIGCLLILLISACSDDDTDDDDYSNDYEDPDHPVIEYTVFERTLAEAVGKVPGEEITPDELATLTHLTVPEPHHHWGLARFTGGWQNIELLSHCINLKELDLSGTPIADLSPLAGLTGLERLNLRNTVISDLQPLAGLVNLQRLDLSENQLNNLTDFQPLAGLVNLQQLDLSRNQVKDLTVLAGMIQLTELNLRGNQIHDITPLANLIRIEKLYLNSNLIVDLKPLANLIQMDKLYLDGNLIVDLKPLVDNPGLVDETREDFDWAGDTVTVSDNPLSDVSRNVYIPALQARGVNVRH